MRYSRTADSILFVLKRVKRTEIHTKKIRSAVKLKVQHTLFVVSKVVLDFTSLIFNRNFCPLAASSVRHSRSIFDFSGCRYQFPIPHSSVCIIYGRYFRKCCWIFSKLSISMNCEFKYVYQLWLKKVYTNFRFYFLTCLFYYFIMLLSLQNTYRS